MASPGQLVDAVAEVLGVPQPTVKVHDYNLSVAGLRSKGGRGRSAAKMTEVDAANLLIAVAASSLVKDTVETVRDYADLPITSGVGNGWDGSISTLANLPRQHTVRDALVALLSAARTSELGDWLTYITLTPGHPPSKKLWARELKVTFSGPFPMVQIELSRVVGDENSRRPMPERNQRLNRYVEPNPIYFDGTEESYQWTPELRARYRPGDLSQLRIFTGTTVLSIGELLND